MAEDGRCFVGRFSQGVGNSSLLEKELELILKKVFVN